MSCDLRAVVDALSYLRTQSVRTLVDALIGR